MIDPAFTARDAKRRTQVPKAAANLFSGFVKGCLVLIILGILAGIALGPMPGGIRFARENAWVQTSRTLALSMFAYANDNDGNYPDGASSTDVFQKLLDGNYISDPTIFYTPLLGKTEPLPGQKLKPENVCFDVTSGLDRNSPDVLPVVFLTGYKIAYAPGGSAVPLVKPYPEYGFEPRTWSQWWHGIPQVAGPPGIAVTYHSNSAKFMRLEDSGNFVGTAPNFISPTFDSKDKTYRQLTPDGVLP